MNKLLLYFFLFLYPFYPLMAWVFHFVSEKSMSLYLNMLLLPVALYFLVSFPRKVPKYLIFYSIFVLYHVASTFITDTIPLNQSKAFFILADWHVFAFSLLVIVENMTFDEKFIARMNRNIFLIVILSLMASVIQIKNPDFLANTTIDMSLFIGEGLARNSSIYAWAHINSIAVTFPILVAILLNFYSPKNKIFIFIILAGIAVAFLTKSRQNMVSILIVFSQLAFAGRVSFKKIASFILILAGSGLLLIFVAGEMGFNIQEVIAERYLEKDFEMGSAKARVTSYEVFVKKFPEHPWLGVGPETRQDVVDLLGGEAPIIHVGYLSYLYFYGIVGCIFIFLAFFYLMKDAWTTGKNYGFWGSFYGLLAFAVFNIVAVYFNFSEMGIILAVIYMRYYGSLYSVTNSFEETEAAYT